MKANEIEIAQILASFSNELGLFKILMQEKYKNIKVGLVVMELNETTVLDETFGKELFVTALRVILEQMEAGLDIDQQLKDILG